MKDHVALQNEKSGEQLRLQPEEWENVQRFLLKENVEYERRDPDNATLPDENTPSLVIVVTNGWESVQRIFEERKHSGNALE